MFHIYFARKTYLVPTMTGHLVWVKTSNELFHGKLLLLHISYTTVVWYFRCLSLPRIFCKFECIQSDGQIKYVLQT